MSGQDSRPRKPTGELGELVFTSEGISHRRIELPDAKEDIERFIVERAFRCRAEELQRLYRNVGVPQQNPENSFDFTMQSESGTESLELMEVAPLETLGGSFETAPYAYTAGELADAVWAEVAKKASKYGESRKDTIHLLLYCTDRRFSPPPPFWTIVSSVAHRERHPFKTIVFCAPAGDDDAYIEVIAPVPSSKFDGFDEAAERRKLLISARLSDGVIAQEGGKHTITFDLGKALRQSRRHGRPERK